MTGHVLLVAHIVVLGYWLGSELVINSTYRLVCYGDALAFPDRDRLMDHVMDVDRHVRYALALQAALGTLLTLELGYVDGGGALFWPVACLGGLWLAFIELVHRRRGRSAGIVLSRADVATRWALAALLLAVASGWLGGRPGLPAWLRLKLAAFAAVVVCGIWIRAALAGHFRIWAEMRRRGPDEATNAAIRRTYVKATSILALLWASMAALVGLSVLKPWT